MLQSKSLQSLSARPEKLSMTINLLNIFFYPLTIVYNYIFPFLLKKIKMHIKIIQCLWTKKTYGNAIKTCTYILFSVLWKFDFCEPKHIFWFTKYFIFSQILNKLGFPACSLTDYKQVTVKFTVVCLIYICKDFEITSRISFKMFVA